MKKIYSVSMPGDSGVKYQSFTYPAGEYQVRMVHDEIAKIQESSEIHITATITNGEVMELALLADALQEAAISLLPMTLILPYLPYSRADRRFGDGDCFGLRVFGRMIDNIGFDRVLTLDCHSPAAKRCISNLFDLDPLPLIREAIRRLGPEEDTIVLLPDEGAAKRYTQGIPCAIATCSKDRDKLTGVLKGFHVPDKKVFQGKKNILIVDDICDGGGTFVGIADNLADKGFEDWKIDSLNLYTTHGIYSKGFSLLSSKFNRIFCSNSFPFRKGGKRVDDIVEVIEYNMPTKLDVIYDEERRNVSSR